MDTEQEAKVISTEKANDSSEGSEDESPPQLSAHALAALQEFYAEEAALEQHLALGEGVAPVRIKEDWVLCVAIIKDIPRHAHYSIAYRMCSNLVNSGMMKLRH